MANKMYGERAAEGVTPACVQVLGHVGARPKMGNIPCEKCTALSAVLLPSIPGMCCCFHDFHKKQYVQVYRSWSVAVRSTLVSALPQRAPPDVC